MSNIGQKTLRKPFFLCNFAVKFFRMKKLVLFFIVLFATAFAQAQTIEQIYHFGNPVVDTRDGYQQIQLEGCLPSGIVGEPTLPWQSVSLILPQGQEAASMTVEFLDYVEMEGTYKIYPYQKPRPYSNTDEIPFAKNEPLYRSKDAYPSRSFGEVSTQYLNGVAFAFGGFTPVLYTPATGKISIARTAIVHVETRTSRTDHSNKLWLTPENDASIRRLAQNPNMLSSYNKRGREIGGYDMLVITAEEWIPHFGEYLSLYNGKGVRTRIVALEEIYATMPGIDEQEQIRNFIIQEYESNGISMVNLGGDVSIVPFRPLWCWAQDEEEDQLPADMYYACLDGSLNDNGDDRWGEVGEDDLLPELGIGRLPFNNEVQFNSIMQKTFSYLLNPVLGEFTSPILGAEDLGDNYYGSNDMDRIIGENSDFGYTSYGYPTDYNFKKHYASPSYFFNSNTFRSIIESGGQYVHHVGHANTGTVAGWDIQFMGDDFFAGNNGIDHNYMLFHSHGCICGDFSHSCILERMVTIPTGFVLTTGNSRYGWYMPWGDGMAAHIHRELITAYCHHHIPSVGMALREAKIATAPWVTINGENGCLRWNIYCLNIMGDGALDPWFDEPYTPNIVYEDGITEGTTTTTVHVSHFDAPLSYYQVSLFDGESLLGRDLTDENGNAELVFDPIQAKGTLQLIVTGQNTWPQIFEITSISSGEPYIYGNIAELDTPAVFGSLLGINGDFYNKGDVAAQNIHASVSSNSPFIDFHESSLSIDDFQPNSSMHFDQIGLFEIADSIPDQTIFTLDLTTQLGDAIHTTHKSFLASAPKLEFSDFVIDDNEGDHNGFADPGEHVTMRVIGKNAGHAIAPDTYLSITCDDENIHLENTRINLGNVESDDLFTAEFGFTTDDDVIGGTIFVLHMELQSGKYTTTYDYVLTVGIAVETFESGDFSFLKWEHGGEQPWFITDDEAHSGNHSARTGNIEKNQFSRLLIYADILQDGEISFWFKTSTKYHKDYFAFYIDDRKKDWWSGENDWTYVSYNFQAGSHVFEWLYGKSGAEHVGSDCAWIDDITLPRTCFITKVEEIVSDKANAVYPNPNNGSFNLELAEESDVIISNMLGQIVMSLHETPGTHQINLSSLGLYLVQIRSAYGVETLKVVVE